MTTQLLAPLFSFLLFLGSAQAATTLKIGVLAPEGSTWAEILKKMAKDVEDQTKGEVKFKVYYGGSQGDEPDVLRKVRVGQLHGGIFTGKTLGDIYGDVRVIELPFNFEGNRTRAQKVLKAMSPYFNNGLTKNKFHSLGYYELGLIYFVSQKQVGGLDSLKGKKIWSWEGDELVNTMINEMGLVTVPLPLPDVLASLSTGVIEAAYAPPMGIVALQWNTKIKYLVDFPLAYSVGAFLLSQKAWSSIPAAQQKVVEEIAKKYNEEANVAIVKDNTDAFDAMKSMGVTFLKFPEADIKKAKEYRDKVVKKLTGKLISAQALSELDKSLKANP